MTLGDFEVFTEESVCALLDKPISGVLDRNNIALSNLSIKHGKNFSSVFLISSLLFRIRVRKKANYIEIKNEYQTLITIDAPRKTNKDFTRYLIRSLNDVDALCPCLMDIVDAEIDNFPKEYDCCSQYKECSDAKICVNPRKDSAIGCGYKKIMKHGRIFYGKNRNV